MKHIGLQNFTGSLKKVPLNTILLPPISPPLPENGPQIIGKVLVNKSKNGVNGEMLVSRPPHDSPTSRTVNPLNGSDNSRVAQLEQNIRFLQEQHELMLTGLHTEIESLKIRNRELQYQLVFMKGSIPSSPSSPEDETKHKVYTSPKPYNLTPLQVEILEKELGELKLQMQETESRNVYLSAIVDEQKKKLERYERDREKERERAMQPDPELLRKLDDAEAIIRRLRRENSDLRREHSSSMNHFQPRETNNQNQSSYSNPRSGSNQSRGGSGRHRGNSGNHYRGNWFPPLHSQSYWQGGRPNDRNHHNTSLDSTLPTLQASDSGGSGSANGSNSVAQQQYQSRRGTNNNHYQNNEGKKYRGGYSKGGKPS